ncbi:MAG TPA: LysR substrate-binding domain-containing protein [Steroidobacteraceae bacterium]|nr:LysR substrate-binding domain-containing protein [Steroidobacteraceae bacterium]
MPASTPPWFLRARIKTRQLMLLIAIGDEGNIHRAAEILRVSQPAASKLLKDLEDALGVTLFERLPRGMRPTWYGEAMIRHARMALSNLAQAGSELEALKTGRFGEVTVGAITGPALSLLPQAVAIVAREQPNLRVQLVVESSDVLLERLVQSKLDIMVGRLSETHDKTNLAYERLADEPVCAVARPNHPLLSDPSLTLRHLEDAPWIVPPVGSVLRHRFELMFQEAGHSVPPQLIETSSILFMTKMLQESDFIAVIPTEVARYYASYGMLAILPIKLSCTMDAFGIILRKDWLLSPAAKVVLRALQSAARSTYDYMPGAPSEPRSARASLRA